MKLELFYPVKPFIVGQKFGQSDACCEDNNVYPVTKRKVTGKRNGVCPPNYIELYPLLGMKGHTGLDLYARHGQKIYASTDGTVSEISTEPERGLGVDVITNERYDMGKSGVHYAKYRNWHLKSINVRKGQEVKTGDILGLADSTGLSSGDHDHFELKPVEYGENGLAYNTEQNNGYFGSIDPLPYFNQYAAEDSQLVIDLMTKLRDALKKLVTMLMP